LTDWSIAFLHHPLIPFCLLRLCNCFMSLRWRQWRGPCSGVPNLFLKFFFVALGLVRRCSTTWATPPAVFCVGYFGHRVSWATYPSRLPNAVPLISPLTDVSHRRWAQTFLSLCHYIPNDPFPI
jgi:hypothetical protein